MPVQIGTASHYGLEEEDEFRRHLQREPRALVLYCGRQCACSNVFKPAFDEGASGDESWSYIIRDVHTGGEGKEAARYGIDVTPTVVAYRNGHEWHRLEGRPLEGIPPYRFEEWIDELEDEAHHVRGHGVHVT